MKWEYCEIYGEVGQYGNSQFMYDLQSKGNEGWELVSMGFVATGIMFEVRAIGVMKRPFEVPVED